MVLPAFIGVLHRQAMLPPNAYSTEDSSGVYATEDKQGNYIFEPTPQ